jgi:hypothetical protein
MGVCFVKGHLGMTGFLFVGVRSVGSSLTCEIRVCAGSTSHSVGALFGGRAMIPLSTGEAREAVPFFAAAFEAKQSIGRRPGSAEADQSSTDDKKVEEQPKSGGFHDRPLDDDAGADELPQRDEQLPGERDGQPRTSTARRTASG